MGVISGFIVALITVLWLKLGNVAKGKKKYNSQDDSFHHWYNNTR
jgi:hypothetical protein